VIVDELLETLDETPRSIITDKGYSAEEVFELLTSLGIAPVIPFRATIAEVMKEKRRAEALKAAGHTNVIENPRRDFDRFDRHGIPRCPNCRGETTFFKFSHRIPTNPKPRLWFRCPLCSITRSIYCEKGWRYLVPLWRTEEAYMALRDSHSEYERVHHHWRERYGVAGQDTDTRPARRGRAVQQLRANAALCIEWLYILLREGWLGSSRNGRPVDPSRLIIRTAREAVSDLLSRRRADGLDQPYTLNAEATEPPDPPPDEDRPPF
jgi:hypothetical protein